MKKKIIISAGKQTREAHTYTSVKKHSNDRNMPASTERTIEKLNGFWKLTFKSK